MRPRKKSKPNPKALTYDTSIREDDRTQVLEETSAVTGEAANESPSQKPSANSPRPLVAGGSEEDAHQTGKAVAKSWYNSGSWRSKASPIAEVARQNASRVGSTNSNTRYGGTSRRRTSRSAFEGLSPAVSTSPPYLSQRMRTSSKSGPLAASMTMVNATSNSSEEQRKVLASASRTNTRTPLPDPPPTPNDIETEVKPEVGKDAIEARPKDVTQEELPKALDTQSSGRRWWFMTGADGKNNNQEITKAKAVPTVVSAGNIPTLSGVHTLDLTQQQNTSKMVVVPDETAEAASAVIKPAGDNNAPDNASEVAGAMPKPADDNVGDIPDAERPLGGRTAVEERSRSWFGFWGAPPQQNPQEPNPLNAVSEPVTLNVQPSLAVDVTPPAGASGPDVPPGVPSEPAPRQPEARPSGWVFWPRAAPRPPQSSDEALSKTDGADAMITDTSPTKVPEAAGVKQPKEVEKLLSLKHNKRGRPISLESGDDSSIASAKALQSEQASSKPTPSPSPGPGATRPVAESQALKQLPKSKPNLLLPAVRDTYHVAQKRSIWQQLGRYLYGTLHEQRHVDIAPSPPRIRKAIAIGVHGYFPATMVQKIIGQPTGTSVRFAEGAAAAINKWTEQHGYDCQVEKVALEGEGMIAGRVDILWKLLLNWVEHIRKADFIMIGCHSQGVPVAIMLVAKLIMFGCVSHAKIGICAMAGVNLGPFSEYKSRYFGGAAAELFDFSSPSSVVSQKYQEALNVALKHGVRIVYIGSIDDQLVSLESATFANVSHPYIYRAVFVDARSHAPSFLTHLVGFALKLRNLGISDHGLIRELSSPLAGSLYSGEGHSTIYNDPAVYDLAVTYALETTDVSDTSVEVKKYEVPGQANPYFLPWAMRGMIEEEYVRNELKEEMRLLLKEFEDWKPVTKALKDVKFRLEAVKSKL